ncbi:hypothetical protein [Methylobacterium sp. Leaf106]|uniref:hypothetical protein n=1 Tax=Methylobacterium sp. Leaf106 TaxID=1736255 RepID=UPI0006F37CF3|nr:hypothetical protein [Methylobacterium sp. Leaf106]KQP45659.1 hypothetical protein ASF34_21330 [Methylobacterium sp. Leaf106]
MSGDPGGKRLALSLTFGALFGFVPQHLRFFCFCLWRDLIDRRDPRGALGILAVLAAGAVGYSVGAWSERRAAGAR